MKLYSYINGNIQAKYQDNTIQIWFPNGDWKKLKDNYLYYYYSKNQVTQISHCNGTNEFHYPDGTIERYPPKMKNSDIKSTFIKLEIWLPNNTYKRIICKSKFNNNNKAGGDLEEFYPNITYPNRPNKH
ncbi:hypothetical protein K502DRAFT_137284 [Neoconidiobolus thromboides FSU 785]|nr:hypothetical protein K502DRAFT_137284 [Neoconidiobolus thromboides FSU 785]